MFHQSCAAIVCSFHLYVVYALIYRQDLINDTYACNNNKTLNDILKREIGFQGCKHLFYIARLCLYAETPKSSCQIGLQL